MVDLFLSFRIDPRGDQNDVQDLIAFVYILCTFGISATVPEV